MISFEKPVTELIRARCSWRTYEPGPLSVEHVHGIHEFLANLPEPPFGSRIRIMLAEAPDTGFGRIRGTYGVISGASNFLVGVMKFSEKSFVDYGYIFESAILKITSLGLATCWMGGTFDRGFFSETAQLKVYEIIPTISPVGIASKKRSLIDSTFALVAGSRKRKPWSTLFFRNTFGTPLSEEEAGPFALALEMVRLAPSATNQQPWRVIMDDSGLHFYLMRTLGYGKIIKEAGLQSVDMGIAMFHFEQTMLESGLPGSWRVLAMDSEALPARTEYVASWVIDEKVL